MQLPAVPLFVRVPPPSEPQSMPPCRSGGVVGVGLWDCVYYSGLRVVGLMKVRRLAMGGLKNLRNMRSRAFYYPMECFWVSYRQFAKGGHLGDVSFYRCRPKHAWGLHPPLRSVCAMSTSKVDDQRQRVPGRQRIALPIKTPRCPPPGPAADHQLCLPRPHKHGAAR